MRNIVRHSARLALLVPLAVAPLVGCAATTEPTVTTSSSTINRTVLYPGGRYQLYGDGVGTPYYWAWIPTGGNINVVPPPAPAIPTAVVTATTAVPAGAGQYQLYGNGTTQPYYWVWVPSGATPPPPPLPPRM